MLIKINAHGQHNFALQKLTIKKKTTVNLCSHLPKQLLPTVPVTTVKMILNALMQCALILQLSQREIKTARTLQNQIQLQNTLNLKKINYNALIMKLVVTRPFAVHQVPMNGLDVIN